MSTELEVIQADVGIDFPLPNGKSVLGKPVAYPEARKILAQIHQFDRTGDFEETIQPALDRFAELTGISEARVMDLCPTMTLGDVIVSIQRFFYRRSPEPKPTAGAGA